MNDAVAFGIAQRDYAAATRRAYLADTDAFADILSRFEAENYDYVGLLQRDRSASLNVAQWSSVGLVIGLSLLFEAIGQLLLSRNQRQAAAVRRRERKHRADQREFTEVLQVTENEGDANELIKRQIERALPASHVTVMSRNNSRDRLEARTALEPGTESVADPRSGD